MKTSEKVKIVHLAYSDDYGGASVAMNRIHAALLTLEGIQSTILTVAPASGTFGKSIYTSWLDKLWLYFCTRVAYKLVGLLQISSNPSGRSINIFPSRVLSRLAKYDFDILHLHWIGNETIRLESLKGIKKPIVWTFHDTWPLMGAEHTDILGSNRFIEGYTQANKPISSKGIDIDRWTWNRKRKVFSEVKIKPIVVSSWLRDQTLLSFLWRDSSPTIIHNPIDFSTWQILDKIDSRKTNNIDANEMIIVFGAVNAFSDQLKGYSILEKAMYELSSFSEHLSYRILVFGDSEIKEVELKPNLKLQSIGKIKDQKILNTIYCCANAVAVPSYQETFGQIAVEAMACGTPVVAFKTSGLLDILIEGENGFFAKPFDYLDFANTLVKTIKHSWNNNAVRETVENRFSLRCIGEKYLTEYLKHI
jgi:glycosyltransferase involved in cell wall biosynthesis